MGNGHPECQPERPAPGAWHFHGASADLVLRTLRLLGAGSGGRYELLAASVPLPEHNRLRGSGVMGLILNLVLLVIGAGGAIVSALALENHRHRAVAVVSFGALGVAGFILTVLTYEQTPDGKQAQTSD